MAHDDQSTREGLSERFKRGQEPTDRLWAAIFALVVLILLVGGLTVIYAEAARTYMEADRKIDYERGSVICMTVVLDNDRTFGLPPFCRRQEVIEFFQPEVCKEFFADNRVCGDRWTEP